MKTLKITLLLMLAEFAGTASMAFTDPGVKIPANTEPGKGFAVVELFTSEGCSSCPPADAVIEKLAKEVKDKPVYILAFHVDYWNRLGWRDVFSDAAYSRRQKNYATWLKLSSVYTPQIVVNGQKEFVGSEEGTLRNTISKALAQSAKYALNLGEVKIDGRKASVHFSTDASAGTTLTLAMVQKKATIVIKAGENRGRTLEHVQIVNDLAHIPLKANTGDAVIKLPAGFSADKFELIALLQDDRTGAIHAATRVAIPNN